MLTPVKTPLAPGRARRLVLLPEFLDLQRHVRVMGTPVVHGPVRAGGEPAVHAVTPRRFTNVLGAAADGLVHRARGRDGRERGEVVAARNRPGGELGVRAGDAGEPRGGGGEDAPPIV